MKIGIGIGWANTRGGSEPLPVYPILFTLCCGGDNLTLYTTAPSIVVGSYLYTDINLTTPFYNDSNYLVQGEFDCLDMTYNGIFTNTSGMVTQIDHSNSCGD
jgi:hypothetical protein